MSQLSSQSTSQLSSKDLALLCAKAAIDKKAGHSIGFEVGKLGAFTDYFLITSGSNERQVQAIADALRVMAREHGMNNPRVEGYDEGRWVLIDFGNVVVHVFHDYIREFYDLESLWSGAPRLKIPTEYFASSLTSSAHEASDKLQHANQTSMVKITFVTIGRFKSDECLNLIGHYLKLARKFAPIEMIELTLTKSEPTQDAALLRFLEKRGSRVFLTLLDERGKTFESREFAARVEKIKDGSFSEWIIAVGGAHGYGDEPKTRAQLKWSLSPLTFAHELALVIAVEQVYRALTIINNHPYHND